MPRTGGSLARIFVLAVCGLVVLFEQAPPDRARAESRTTAIPRASDPPRYLIPFHPAIHTSTIGHSIEGRPIQLGCIGGGRETLLLVGGMHMGDEENTVWLLLELSQLAASGALHVPSQTRLCMIPMLNPDGLMLDRRTNAREVDLNRNWPASNWSSAAQVHHESVSGGAYPLSEPEARALHDYVAATRPAAVIVWHCCADLVEANNAPRGVELGIRFAVASGLPYVIEWPHYPISGQFMDAMESIGIPALDIELAQPGVAPVRSQLAGVAAVLTSLAHAAEDQPLAQLPPRPTWLDGLPVRVGLSGHIDVPLTPVERREQLTMAPVVAGKALMQARLLQAHPTR